MNASTQYPFPNLNADKGKQMKLSRKQTAATLPV